MNELDTLHLSLNQHMERFHLTNGDLGKVNLKSRQCLLGPFGACNFGGGCPEKTLVYDRSPHESLHSSVVTDPSSMLDVCHI